MGKTILISDLAVCKKILARKVDLEDVYAVEALRTNNWDIMRITGRILDMDKH